MKQEHYIFGLLGIGAAIVLYFLWKESQAPATTVSQTVVPAAVDKQPYPNSAPIQLGDVNIGTASPQQLYNIPSADQLFGGVKIGTAHSDCGCAENECEGAGLPVTVQTIPEHVVKQALKTYAAFAAKGSAPSGFTSAGSQVSFQQG